MTHPPFLLRFVLTVTVAFTATAVHASDPTEGRPDPPSHSFGVARPTEALTVPFPHLRVEDSQMRALIDDAIAGSATVRALVARITASDVVVFVACERNPAVKVSGRLNFMVSAGGVRYLVIRLKPAPRLATIAMLAHELQHAAEIADTPSIVDGESLGREYERIGYRSRASHGGLAFDTRAAVETGRRVAEELTSAEQVARRVAP